MHFHLSPHTDNSSQLYSYHPPSGSLTGFLQRLLQLIFPSLQNKVNKAILPIIRQTMIQKKIPQTNTWTYTCLLNFSSLPHLLMMVLVIWEHWWLGGVAVEVGGGAPPMVMVFWMRSGDSRNCWTVRLLEPSRVTLGRGRAALTSVWLMSVRKVMLLCPWAPVREGSG